MPRMRLFYIQEGQVKLTVVSPQGKEAVVAILEPEAFLGEACLVGQGPCAWRPRPPWVQQGSRASTKPS